jgi:hypothetical protein
MRLGLKKHAHGSRILRLQSKDGSTRADQLIDRWRHCDGLEVEPAIVEFRPHGRWRSGAEP